MQLDLFEHSRDVILRNDAIDAARSRDVAKLTGALKALEAAYGSDPILPKLRTLSCRMGIGLSPGSSREQALEVLHMTQDCVAVAQQLFGTQATTWLAPWWEELAAAGAGLRFDPSIEALHPAALLLRAQRWTQARASAQSIESWRRQPAPLAWCTQAELRISGLSAAWPFLAELCWMAPTRAAALIAKLNEVELDALVRRFEAQCEHAGESDGFAWFPAWTLIALPQWAGQTRLAQPGANTAPERAVHLLLNLLSLERQGLHASLIEERARLRALNPDLFALYMRTR